MSTFATMPNFASPQLETITACESSTPSAAGAHHQRGLHKSVIAAAIKARPATSQATPSAREMGSTSCGRSARPKALENPSRWMSP